MRIRNTGRNNSSCNTRPETIPGEVGVDILDFVGLLGQDLHGRVLVDRHGPGGDEKFLGGTVLLVTEVKIRLADLISAYRISSAYPYL